ncbi:hypothetical protein BO70DRAFT_393805 [Aspergillus heteromorphus CBS 117.55]|uniref:Uncharacterized protein n=1 Tax=Aspergillus heteromorphus CBS 117.55 TaxID=1448321 RepID=A0A317WYM3_9EURO|nr:uncharacterized protein BO70DRAFT_393805 [Aspergillus heteromorphus CBS 117.55]PWY89310.1 hypothetical protein BO70DRAFT_393805 [Aspergillus heteromorphus CBS 117.55]
MPVPAPGFPVCQRVMFLPANPYILRRGVSACVPNRWAIIVNPPMDPTLQLEVFAEHKGLLFCTRPSWETLKGGSRLGPGWTSEVSILRAVDGHLGRHIVVFHFMHARTLEGLGKWQSNLDRANPSGARCKPASWLDGRKPPLAVSCGF